MLPRSETNKDCNAERRKFVAANKVLMKSQPSITYLVQVIRYEDLLCAWYYYPRAELLYVRLLYKFWSILQQSIPAPNYRGKVERKVSINEGFKHHMLDKVEVLEANSLE